MEHHKEEAGIRDEGLYYVVGLLSGLFVGVILQSSFIWVPVLGIVGLLFTAFFLAIFVRGRGDKA